MIIIRCKMMHRPEEMKKLREQIREEAETGLILLPANCELLGIVDDDQVQVLYPDGTDAIPALTLVSKEVIEESVRVQLEEVILHDLKGVPYASTTFVAPDFESREK